MAVKNKASRVIEYAKSQGPGTLIEHGLMALPTDKDIPSHLSAIQPQDVGEPITCIYEFVTKDRAYDFLASHYLKAA